MADIEGELRAANQPLEKYCDMIALIVTKFDHVDEDDEQVQRDNIIEVFSNKDSQISVDFATLNKSKIIFSTKTMPATELSNQMYVISKK